MQTVIDEEWEKANEGSSASRIFKSHPHQQTTEIHAGRDPARMKDKHKPNLGKPVAAAPLLVQAVVQEPLADGLSDFD